MTAILAAAVFLAQVGIGIDRPPATAPASLRVSHGRTAREHSSTPNPLTRHTAAPAAEASAAPVAAGLNLCKHAADVAIESATQEKTDSSGGTDNYLIHVSILNRGAVSQGPHARQLISVYRNEDRIVRMQIPSLEAGEAYAFTTKFKRSSEAGPNSTTLLFRLGGENYAPRSTEDCNDANNSFRLTF